MDLAFNSVEHEKYLICNLFIILFFNNLVITVLFLTFVLAYCKGKTREKKYNKKIFVFSSNHKVVGQEQSSLKKSINRSKSSFIQNFLINKNYSSGYTSFVIKNEKRSFFTLTKNPNTMLLLNNESLFRRTARSAAAVQKIKQTLQR